MHYDKRYVTICSFIYLHDIILPHDKNIFIGFVIFILCSSTFSAAARQLHRWKIGNSKWSRIVCSISRKRRSFNHYSRRAGSAHPGFRVFDSLAKDNRIIYFDAFGRGKSNTAKDVKEYSPCRGILKMLKD